MKIKSVYIAIVVVTIICFSAVYILSNSEKSGVNNGFRRNFSKNKLKLYQVVQLPNSSYTFAFHSEKNVVLKNDKDQLKLFKKDFMLRDLGESSLKIKPNFKFDFNTIGVDIQPNTILLVSIKGDVLTLIKNKLRTFKLPNHYMESPYLISDNSAILRIANSNHKGENYQISKISFSKSASVIKSFQLPNYPNGLFYNDGFLAYDREYNKLFYMYAYRGEFVCLDTNLNLVYKAKTIDTVRTPNLKLGSEIVKTKNGIQYKSTTQLTPPNLVNRYLTVNNDRIYVISRLRADNETKSSFLQNQPIGIATLKLTFS